MQYNCPLSDAAEDVEYDDLFFNELGAESKAYAKEDAFLDAINGSKILGVTEARRQRYEK